MLQGLNNISINDTFWVQVKPYLISFGFKGLPKNTHFTIVFDKNEDDINLHVTKNAEDQTDKPKIGIFRIDKTILQEDANKLSLAFLNWILQPFDFDKLKGQYNYKFISFSKLQDSEISLSIEEKFIDSFKDILKRRKKTRLKVEGDIEGRLESFATQTDWRAAINNNIIDPLTDFQQPIDGGIVIWEDKTLTVIRIQEKWFKFRTDFTPFELLTIAINPKSAKRIIWKTKRALIALKGASKYQDTEHLDTPIRLEKNPSRKVAKDTRN